MSARIIAFPSQRRARPAILIVNADDGLLVLTPRGHGWMHGDIRSARADARWLARNLQLPVLDFAS